MIYPVMIGENIYVSKMPKGQGVKLCWILQKMWCYKSAHGDPWRRCTGIMRDWHGWTSDRLMSLPREAELLANGIVQCGLRYDSTLWQMLGLVHFEACHTDRSMPAGYLHCAVGCFRRMIKLDVMKDYLYANLYTIYYEQKDYELAAPDLTDYKTAFSGDDMPQSLRGMMLITIEDEKPLPDRNYEAAQREYIRAGELLRSDDATYY